MGRRRALQIVARLALEEVADTAIDVIEATGDADNAFAAVANFGPHRPARAGAMHDAMGNAAERYHCARLERCSLRQATKTSRDPRTVTLREVFGFSERAARRDREDRFSVARMNSERVTARSTVPAQPNCKELRPMGDQNRLRFVGPTIEECASGHVCQSGEQEFARILP